VISLARGVDQTGITYEGLAFGRGGGKPEGGTDKSTIQHLETYNACGDVTVHNRPNVDKNSLLKMIHVMS
jgi:hypothetical protein